MEEHPNKRTENGPVREATAALPPTSDGGGESLRSELSRLLYRPLPVTESEKLTTDESSLSVLPWKIDCKMPYTTNKSESQSSLHFPALSYLDLRRLQNTSYADSQCIKAQAELQKSEPKPVKFWKQALQLVPDHLPSLVGYARYLLDRGKLDASEDLLEQAVAIDPKHTVAKKLLFDLARRRQLCFQKQTVVSKLPFANHGTTNNNSNLTARESSAYQDALMERQLLASPKDTNDIVETEEDSESYREKQRKEDRKRKKHRKERDRRKRKKKDRRRHHKRRRRHRRRRYDSSDESSRSSSEDDEISYRSKDSNKSLSGSNASRQEHLPREHSNEARTYESDKEDRRRKRRKRRRRDYDDDRKHKSRTKNDERKRHKEEHKHSKDDSSTSST